MIFQQVCSERAPTLRQAQGERLVSGHGEPVISGHGEPVISGHGERSRTMIAVVDYGMGNLASVAKALRFLGARPQVTCRPRDIARAQAVVFPGVGAFGEAMGELRRRRLVAPLLEAIGSGKPFLGLCLGLQLLFEASDESPGVKGLSVFRGRVRRLPSRPGLKIPHMGWNQIERSRRGRDPRFREDDILQGVPEGAFMYFVHSYYADPKEGGVVAARTRHGLPFPSVVSDGRKLWATQFHPEKSQVWGLKILSNFLHEVSLC
jgi:glutamine amidotransferase